MKFIPVPVPLKKSIELPESGTPEFALMMEEFREETNRIIRIRCAIESIQDVYTWCEHNNIKIQLRNHWSANDNGGFAAFEMLKETYTEERKLLFILRWA